MNRFRLIHGVGRRMSLGRCRSFCQRKSDSLLFGAGLLVAVVLALVALTAPAAFAAPLEENFKADEAIQTLTLKLEVGAAGADLEEPVALDLGLGFPFWLHPLGRPENTTAPFGAVPQQTTASGKLAAGSSATFTFSLTGDLGQDVFLTTPQLLADVRISDISRVGLASPGNKDWILAGYELQINGRPFAAAASLAQGAKQAQDAARAKLADVNGKIAPLMTEHQTLADFIKAKLATEADLKRLAEVDGQLVPLVEQKVRLENQLPGESPWFEDSAFTSPWRDKSVVQTARVTLITRSHTAADTRNYIYFVAGAHKYLLATPGAPLSFARGPQVFVLDLLRGPLSAADLRGWGVGMLAPANPFDRAPDRWHPERILVEVDNRITYDSEDSPIDRESLKAMRLIPPVHVDQQGMLVNNQPIDRETFVWRAGQGLGLNLAGGGSLPLPPVDDPTYPPPEPGNPLVDPGTPPTDPGNPIPDPSQLADGSEAFPGEVPGDWGDDETGGGDWEYYWGDYEPLGDGFELGPFDDGFGGGAGLKILDLLAWLWQLLQGGGGGVLPSPLPPGQDPAPAGDDFQIKDGSVAIASGWKADDSFTIQWDVTGDESQIDHYEVSLVEIYPEREVYLGGTLLKASAAAGARQHSGVLQTAKPAEVHYLAPVVVAVPKDAQNQTPHQRMGPARAVFPAALSLTLPTVKLADFFSGDMATNPLVTYLQAVSWGGPPPGTTHAVWPVIGAVDGHPGIVFDHPVCALNVAARLAADDALLTVPFALSSKLPAGKYRLVAHLGFAGGLGGNNAATVDVKYVLKSDITAPGFTPQPFERKETFTVVSVIGDTPQPMKLVSWVVDTADAAGFAGPYDFDVKFTYHGSPMDAAYPPTLFGVRLIPEP